MKPSFQNINSYSILQKQTQRLVVNLSIEDVDNVSANINKNKIKTSPRCDNLVFGGFWFRVCIRKKYMKVDM